MPKKTEPNRWRSAGRDSLLAEIATELAKKHGKESPTEIELTRARELLMERAQYRILVVHSNTLESGFMLSELEQQNFSVAGVTSMKEAEELVREANLCIVEKHINGDIDQLKEIRANFEYERLPIYVFSDQVKPESLPLVEWMPKPMYPELVRRVLHEWQAWRGASFISSLENPLDALLTDMMLNCDKLRAKHDTGLEQVISQQLKTFIEHAPTDNRRFGVALYFTRTKRTEHVEVPGVKKLSGISTDDIYTVEGLSKDSAPFCLKFFNDEQRATVEIEALRELAKREKEDNLDFGVEVPINAPKMLLNEVLKYVGKDKKEYYLAEEYIRGPMLYTLMPEIVEKARTGDHFAQLFRRASAFVKNAQIAKMQENDLLNLGFQTSDTDYGAKVSENLTGNMKFFRVKPSEELLSCLDACITALYSGLVIEQTQYFDYNDTNLMMKIGAHRRSKLGDVEKSFLDYLGKDILPMYGYTEVRSFTARRLSKVDFNKIFRKTSILEDTAHEFSYVDWTPEEREQLDVHFMLYKKAMRIISNLKEQKKKNLMKQEQLKDLASLKDKIAKIERNEMNPKDLANTINELNDYTRHKQTQPYIQLYRNIRWFGHVLRRYIPEHRQVMAYAGDGMKKLCGDSYSRLFDSKRGFSLEAELAKHLQRSPNRDKRHFMAASYFESRNASDMLKNTLGPRLDDFVSFANMYLGAYQDSLHDNDHLEHYFKRSSQVLESIMISARQSMTNLPEIPLASIDDKEGLIKYKEAVRAAHDTAVAKGAQHASTSHYIAAKFIQYVISKLSNERIDYDKLSRAGVKE